MERFGLDLKLVAASTEGQQSDPEFAESAMQACKDASAANAWNLVNFNIAQAVALQKTPIPQHSPDQPGFMVDALEVSATVEDGLPALARVLDAWLQACSGRTVRLRLRGVEVEAASGSEVERLLAENP